MLEVKPRTAVFAAIVALRLYRLVLWLREMSNPKHHLVRIKGSQTPRPPPHTDIMGEFFKNKDGIYIFTKAWFPEGSPKGVVFLVHGFGEHSGRYGHVARRLNAIGLAVFALDHQGHGRSEGDRAHVERFSDYVADVLEYIDRVFKGHHHSYGAPLNDLPRFLLGHSMGGLIALRTAMSLRDDLSAWHGLVMSGPLLQPDPAAATPVMVFLGKLLSNLLPKAAINSLDPAFVCKSTQVVEVYVNDPLNYTGGMRARWGMEALSAMKSANEGAASFTWPFLLVQGADDRLCHPNGARNFHAVAGSTDKSLVIYPSKYHEIFNDPGYELVLDDVCDWIQCRVPLTSRGTDDANGVKK